MLMIGSTKIESGNSKRKICKRMVPWTSMTMATPMANSNVPPKLCAAGSGYFSSELTVCTNPSLGPIRGHQAFVEPLCWLTCRNMTSAATPTGEFSMEKEYILKSQVIHIYIYVIYNIIYVYDLVFSDQQKEWDTPNVAGTATRPCMFSDPWDDLSWGAVLELIETCWNHQLQAYV